MYFISCRNVTGSPWPLSGGLDGTKVKVEGIIFLGFKDKDVHWPNDLSINLKIVYFCFIFPMNEETILEIFVLNLYTLPVEEHHEEQ